MNSLLRPALYGAYHEIVNLTRLEEPPRELVNIVGPICESADVLGHDRLLPPTREGDVLLIANAGAYGHAMSSHYNLRSPAEEIVL
ncbi:MAG: bifunctional aspartate kinase/diaminopimelate decarboxylase, partial [Pseudomonadota bacterium]|jgi:diaminopimelate decarboxylase/aspartate kinase|nr:bifunctional aspartate kinase/diaminopimelate decarboxylase [Pseudomonadota bacterium]